MEYSSIDLITAFESTQYANVDAALEELHWQSKPRGSLIKLYLHKAAHTAEESSGRSIEPHLPTFRVKVSGNAM